MLDPIGSLIKIFTCESEYVIFRNYVNSVPICFLIKPNIPVGFKTTGQTQLSMTWKESFTDDSQY